MKKLVGVLIAIIALSLVLAPTTVLAGSPSTPNYGVVDPVKITNLPPEWMYDVEKIIPAFKAPGGQIRVVMDGLAATPDGGSASGTIVFRCQSTVGFQYDIVATGLTPLSRHSVVGAEGRRFVYFLSDPGDGSIEIEPGLWASPWLATPTGPLDLGTFRTDSNGLGGVRGSIRLDAGYVYEISVEVFAAGGTKVLGPAIEGGVADTTGFIVY